VRISQPGPILLDATVTVGTNQIVQIPDTTRLKNPFDTGMWLDEIRFRVSQPTSGSVGDPDGAYMAIGAEIRMGRMPLTSGYVPIGLLAKVLLGEQTTNGDLSSQLIWPGAAYHTWKLPKPLFVPATEVVIPKFTNIPNYQGLGDGPLVVEVALVGRVCPREMPAPDVLCVPWAASWLSTIIAASGQSNPVLEQSAEKDLVNPFDDPLFVERFIGRSALVPASLSFQTFEWYSAGLGVNAGPAYGDRLITVQAYDSFGNILVRDPTPFQHLFQILDRSWTVNSMLQPKGFFIFQLARDFTNVSRPVAGLQNGVGIGMVGYRRVRTTGAVVAPQRGQQKSYANVQQSRPRPLDITGSNARTIHGKGRMTK
jgi:hypothetical protein